MAGAIDRIAAMTAAYVTERQQFGRPISAFQVVAHGAARLATLAQAATWAARLACTSTDPSDTAAAKGWISAASVEVAALAHQLHGAIGFTEEYGLQRLSKRLRSLRFSYGDDRFHHRALGPARLMEYSPLLAGRRSTRRFDTDRDVPDDVLERVLAAPLAMPHAGNTYDWRGVVLRRRDRDPASVAGGALRAAGPELRRRGGGARRLRRAARLVGGAVPGQHRRPRRAGPDRPRPPPRPAGHGGGRAGGVGET